MKVWRLSLARRARASEFGFGFTCSMVFLTPHPRLGSSTDAAPRLTQLLTARWALMVSGAQPPQAQQSMISNHHPVGRQRGIRGSGEHQPGFETQGPDLAGHHHFFSAHLPHGYTTAAQGRWADHLDQDFALNPIRSLAWLHRQRALSSYPLSVWVVP